MYTDKVSICYAMPYNLMTEPTTAEQKLNAKIKNQINYVSIIETLQTYSHLLAKDSLAEPEGF